jgi:uncharacterized protein Yka (UPF0111/DUF47 family)
MRWLLPKDDAFFVLFERSAATIVAAAEALEDLFADEITAERFQPLDDYEHQGDAITHEVINRLSRTFITPMDRDDIYRLIHVLDDVVDATEAAGETALLCKVGRATPQARELSRVLCEISREVAALAPALRGGSTDHHPHVVRAHDLENEGDRCWADAFAALFDGDLAPVDVIKWKEIYEQIEEAIDAAELSAQIIEEIVYKIA